MQNSKNLVIIDAYDSFVYNIHQYFSKLGCMVDTVRFDSISIESLNDYDYIVLSPGPGRPEQTNFPEVIKRYSGKIPILGVCLGHQAIGHSFGSKVILASRIMHGKTSSISHDGKGIFRDIPSPFTATRYHSLVVDKPPKGFEVSAKSDDGFIMALRNESLMVEGVQFHPESILTENGIAIFRNFLEVYSR